MKWFLLVISIGALIVYLIAKNWSASIWTVSSILWMLSSYRFEKMAKQ